MIGWDEILQGGLAPKAIVMSWRGRAAASKRAHEAFRDHVSDRHLLLRLQPGRTQSRAGEHRRLRPLARVYGYEPVPKALSADDAKYILGAQANLWTEYIATPEHVEYMVFPRLLALAESVWSPAAVKDYADFMRRLPYQLGRLDKQACATGFRSVRSR